MTKSCTFTCSGSPFGRHSRTAPPAASPGPAAPPTRGRRTLIGLVVRMTRPCGAPAARAKPCWRFGRVRRTATIPSRRRAHCRMTAPCRPHRRADRLRRHRRSPGAACPRPVRLNPVASLPSATAPVATAWAPSVQSGRQRDHRRPAERFRAGAPGTVVVPEALRDRCTGGARRTLCYGFGAMTVAIPHISSVIGERGATPCRRSETGQHDVGSSTGTIDAFGFACAPGSQPHRDSVGPAACAANPNLQSGLS